MFLEERKEDNLIVESNLGLIKKAVTIKKGQVLKRGTVLAINEGLCEIVDSSNDLIKEPYAILCDDVDATEKDLVATAYFTGGFRASELIFGGNDTVKTHEKALRTLNIHLF